MNVIERALNGEKVGLCELFSAFLDESLDFKVLIQVLNCNKLNYDIGDKFTPHSLSPDDMLRSLAVQCIVHKIISLLSEVNAVFDNINNATLVSIKDAVFEEIRDKLDGV